MGLCLSLTVLLIVNIFKVPFSPFTLTILCLAGYALSIIILEFRFLKTYNNSSTGLDFSIANNSFNLKRSAVKLLGLYGTLLLIGFIYWLLPEYDKPFYYHFFSLVETILPIVLILAIPYFLIIDSFMTNPHDGYWQIGNICLLNFEEIELPLILQHCLGWLVKLFFLPMMYGYFFQKVLYFQAVDISIILTSFKLFFETTFSLLIYVDLLIGTVGYILTLRIFDSHIRSTERSFFGWFIAVVCYQPFSALVWTVYLAYKPEDSWVFWFSDYPVAYVIWGLLILGLKSIYVWSSLSFGIRFSNLTHRGILTNGPYRYCKHPAYVSKNLSWWLIFMPFLSTISASEAIRLSLLLVMVNFIYFMRAKTEERHLSCDPEYIAYANYIERKGLFSYLGNKIPILKFKQNRLMNFPDKS